MTLPTLGAAIKRGDFDILEPWLRAGERAIEIQDFVFPEVLAGDTAPLVESYRACLRGYGGPIGLHGPFFGLDIANPEPEIRAVIRRRLIQVLEITQALGGSHMVIHSPFTYWHVLNRHNYPQFRAAMFEAAADCLAPVLARAEAAGVTLVLENIDDTDPAARVELVRAIDHACLRVSLDTGHAELAHGRYNAPPVVDFIAAAGDSLAHVHLQDADGYADRHWHPGEGCIPWPAVFNALARLPQCPRLILEVRNNLGRLPATVARLEALGLAR
ncbi:sugar phosphate isomerase [Defluviimonas sp. 20V17]|uniref:Sugar phosphate isomerase n=1 Tax=Allgaiera indica TaxID=765699 RepID=A0AAN4UPG6_9RHOB|nr:sugar phosphate isomerase/epimerase family protein [Allgaiera indica]KDB04545.1 sugar phosphate isomerase [Defluviimonas sp. 20V17]GHD99706.1 sugar phosphate isomerase [Allgaiera indica]SDW20088.1 Sugar phosphate isomerase/epimerase [Allgaiera indica]